MDLLTKIGTIIGIIAGIFGIFYWIYTRWKDKKEKEKEKELEASKLPQCKVTLLHRIILEKDEYDFVIGIPENQKKTDHYFLPLPISIANFGKYDLEDIKVIFKYVAKSPLPISDEAIGMEMITGLVKATRQYKKTDDGQYTTFLFDRIPQKVAAQINEPIRLFSSINAVEFPAESKDGVKFMARVKYEMLFFFEFFFLAKNTEIKKIKLKIYVYPSKDLSDLIVKVKDKIYENRNKDGEERFPEEVMVFYPDYKLAKRSNKDQIFMASVNYTNFRKVFVSNTRIHIGLFEDNDNPIDEIPL